MTKEGQCNFLASKHHKDLPALIGMTTLKSF